MAEPAAHLKHNRSLGALAADAKVCDEGDVVALPLGAGQPTVQVLQRGRLQCALRGQRRASVGLQQPFQQGHYKLLSSSKFTASGHEWRGKSSLGPTLQTPSRLAVVAMGRQPRISAMGKAGKIFILCSVL